MTATLPPSDEVALLTGWAAHLGRSDQDQLLLALANLLGSPLGPRSRLLFEALLPALAHEAEPDVRRELAHRTADAAWAPGALLERLAADAEAETAASLARSPALSDSAATILLLRHPATAAALAGNVHVRLSEESLARLIEAARRDPALRAAVARRQDLGADQAQALAAFVSPGLRRTLLARFGLEDAPERSSLDAGQARRLVDKLSRSGRLTPGYALHALRGGRLQVFQQAMAVLGDLPGEAVESASSAEDPASLALACAAGGVDQAVFPEVLREVRALNGGRPAATSPDAVRGVIAAFARRPAEAAEALRAGEARRLVRWSAG